MDHAVARSDSDRLTRYGAVALALLVFARIAVSFQFQSVAPLLPILEARFQIGYSGFGLLLGLYMAPGIVVALCLPALLVRLGRPMLVGLAFSAMAAGELLLWSAPGFAFACAARLLSGTGGCVIYIVTINMTADLSIAGRRPVRMGLIAASWPLGNALALVALGSLAHLSADIARFVPVGLIVLAATATQALLQGDRQRGGTIARTAMQQPSLGRWRLVMSRIFLISLCFALYNIAFILLTGFSPRILIEDGFEPVAASGAASIPMWMFLVSVPLGGYISGHTLAGDFRLVAAGCALAAISVLASLFWGGQITLYALAGLAGGLPTASILARGRALSGENADITYSALFFVFFAVLVAIPPAVGLAADLAGTAHLIPWVIAALLALSIALFARTLRQPALDGPV